MRTITVKGFKKTGKTTTCTRIIGELVRRGYTVGSSKDTHFEGFAMDRENTDSWRHANAGASTVIISGLYETDVLYKRRIEVRDLLDLYEEEYLVTEGETGLPIANIVTGKTKEDLEKRRDEHTIAFSGIIAGELTEYGGLPVIDATRDIEALVDLIAERSTEMKEAGEKELILKFDGEDVPMVPFVQDILKETVLGLVKTLKGYEEGMDITIEIKE